jgi:RimJ/RimL family protein N-acetyltransferase
MSQSNPSATTDRPLLLQGELVGLALMRREDVPVIARWHQDLEFTANIGVPGDAHTLEMREESFTRNSRVRSDSVEFAVIRLEGRELIGFGGLFDITRALTATLFVGIGEHEWRGRGCGIEATRLICEYGFFFRSLHNIKVEVNGYNRRAIRLYERLGFRKAGRIRGAVMLNGNRYDQVVMDLLRSELEPKHVARFQDLERSAGATPA